MGVDLNVTLFVDHVVNQREFRDAISSHDEKRIKDALRDPQWRLELSEIEIDAATRVLLGVENLGNISHLEEILSHHKINFRGN